MLVLIRCSFLLCASLSSAHHLTHLLHSFLCLFLLRVRQLPLPHLPSNPLLPISTALLQFGEKDCRRTFEAASKKIKQECGQMANLERRRRKRTKNNIDASLYPPLLLGIIHITTITIITIHLLLPLLIELLLHLHCGKNPRIA